MNYISIGAQCTTAELFQKLKIKHETLPFDWMLSYPRFTYLMLHMLLVDKMDIHTLVHEHFFKLDKRTKCVKREHYYETNTDVINMNSKYDVIFPHDPPTDHDKYIRRFQRLKDMILNCSINLTFVFVSFSSKQSGNYTVNGKDPSPDTYEYLDKIYQLIHKTRDGNKFKFVVYDAINAGKQILSKDIIYVPIASKPVFYELFGELQQKFVY